MAKNPGYEVGGVRSERPFKIRRLGHVGADTADLSRSLDLFVRDLGLSVSDEADFRTIPAVAEVAATVADPRGMFLTTGSDHHSVVLVPRPISQARRGPTFPDEVTNGQVSFQVNSLAEVAAARQYLMDAGYEVPRIGRDMPGSNWHTYFRGPDDLIIELYYGMEQIGWSGSSKPRTLYTGATAGDPDLPVVAERDEVTRALDGGAELAAGHRHSDLGAAEHDVGGVLLPRPFRVTGFGVVSFFVEDVARSVDFFTDVLGLTLTETVDLVGHSLAFLRAGTEHHTVALFPKALRAFLGLPEDNSNATLGFQVGSYEQLRAAARFLSERGWRLLDEFPPKLHTGIDRVVVVEDGHGRRVMLYYYMERIGWDGRPRPAHLRPKPVAGTPLDWPPSIEAPEDVYCDAPFLGPIG